MDKNKLKFLDTLRGFASIYVLVGHSRWLLWEGWSSFKANSSEYSIINKLVAYFFLLFRFGHESVMFFFVLSGFVIHLRYSKGLKLLGEKQSFDFWDYLKRRASRILPPYLFALILTFILDTIVRLNNYSIYFHQTPDKLANQNILFNHSIDTLIGNLLFLQGTFVGVFGSNGPLWSLMYEWWFYMLYPVCFILVRKNVSIGYFVIFALSFYHLINHSLLPKWPSMVISYLGIWWLGAVLADFYTNHIKISMKWTGIGLLFFIFSILTAKFQLSNLLYDWSVGLGMFGLIGVLLSENHYSDFVRKLLVKIDFFSRSSYTLYVIHFPILVVLNGVILKVYNNKLPNHFLFVVGASFFCVFFAQLVSIFLEKNRK